MNDIICPNCKKAFKVDEAGFADILKQVRDHRFEEELIERLNIVEKEKESAVKRNQESTMQSLRKNFPLPKRSIKLKKSATNLSAS